MLKNIDSEKPTYVRVLQFSSDGKGAAMYTQAKKSMSCRTERMCRACNCTSSERMVPYDYASTSCPKLLATLEYHERDIALVAEEPKFSAMLGESSTEMAELALTH